MQAARDDRHPEAVGDGSVEAGLAAFRLAAENGSFCLNVQSRPNRSTVTFADLIGALAAPAGASPFLCHQPPPA
jgi:hypothetical protein